MRVGFSWFFDKSDVSVQHVFGDVVEAPTDKRQRVKIWLCVPEDLVEEFVGEGAEVVAGEVACRKQEEGEELRSKKSPCVVGYAGVDGGEDVPW